MKGGTIEVSKNELMTDLLFERKLEAAIDGLPPFYRMYPESFRRKC
jgi:hypothetical protein